ncbi:hypothetical protein A2164_00310 [Candidatus Curtissbacteria bacterium RBG_13_35_7]|uniref:Rod shape-determining protein RodA n=1 Tax=Candidatus Curtissbacteria bacterium RBG_13_35_7 TaxID=1797705 RepID=A0A1F5G0V3_9BACT|nr:MAG: hypothetical protein A2164_00310 [Candidatus Curtissbacteria bacterium RBG_13_35_7]
MRNSWDWLLFSQILAIGAISLLIISSINKDLALNQLFFWFIGLLILFLTSQINYRNWLSLTKILYIVSLIFLISLFIVGTPIRGSVRWIELGIFRVQPAELAKAASILALANFYLHNSAKQINSLIKSFVIILPLIILIFFQPDIGNTFAFFAIWLGISFTAGLKLKHLTIIILATVLSFVLFYEMLAPYQKERISGFFNLSQDPLNTGYNLIQSKIAIGSGLIFGKGYGHGTQSQLNFLPEAESDFIFASIAEQLGFLGASMLLILFSWLILKMVNRISQLDRFGQLISVGIICYFTIQFLVNVGMNLGLMPVTGITFPLVSYGGSSLITNLFLLGITFSVYRNSRITN